MSVPNRPESEEFALVERARAGDQEAFRALVIYYEPRIFAYLWQMLGNRENARDILQETFLTIFQALPTWQPGRTGATGHPLAPWIYRIATNKALSFLRGQAVREKHGEKLMSDREEQASQGRIPFLVQEQPSVEERYITRELLHLALLKLKTDEAACLIAHFVNGERYAEIAERLGLSSEAVRKRIQRALTALRQAYQEIGLEAWR